MAQRVAEGFRHGLCQRERQRRDQEGPESKAKGQEAIWGEFGQDLARGLESIDVLDVSGGSSMAEPKFEPPNLGPDKGAQG